MALARAAEAAADPEALIPEARERQRRRRIRSRPAPPGLTGLGLAFYVALGRRRTERTPRRLPAHSHAVLPRVTACGDWVSESRPRVASGRRRNREHKRQRVRATDRSPRRRPRVARRESQPAAGDPAWAIYASRLHPRAAQTSGRVRAVLYRAPLRRGTETAPVRPTLVVRFRSGLTVQARTPPTDWAGSSGCYSRWVAEVSPVVADS